MKKLIALLLCLCLMLTAFAGCGQSRADASESEAASPAEAAAEEEPTEEEEPAAEEEPAEEEEPAAEEEPAEEEEPAAEEEPAEEEEPAAEEEPAEEEESAAEEEPAEEPAEEEAPASEEPAGIGLGGTGFGTYPADTVVGTVNGTDVTWVEYYYWLNYYTSISQQLGSMLGTAPDGWDASDLYLLYTMASMYGYLSVDLSAYGLTEESTNAELVTKLAQTNIVQYHTIQTELESMGVTLSEEDEAAIRSVVEQNADGIEGVGDGDGTATEEELTAFAEYLENEMNMNLDFFNYMNTVSLLETEGFKTLYGEGGAELSDEEAVAFAADNDVLSAKHILLLTIDPATREALPEEEITEKLALAEELNEKLHEEQDKEAMKALFDELTAQYTEDTGYASFPDGYLFTAGEMVAEFENAVRELDEDYGLSDIVESSYGYHIILRIPVDPDGILQSVGATVRNVAAAQTFYGLEDEWVKNADVQWNEGFEAPDLAAIFG